MGVFIEVQDEPRLFRTVNLPPQRFPLPLAAGARASPLHLLTGLVGALCLFGAIAVPIAAPAWMRSIPDALVAIVVGLFMAVVGLCFAAAALTALLDLMRSSPLLVLEEDTFLDRRLMQRPLPGPTSCGQGSPTREAGPAAFT